MCTDVQRSKESAGQRLTAEVYRKRCTLKVTATGHVTLHRAQAIINEQQGDRVGSSKIHEERMTDMEDYQMKKEKDSVLRTD